MRLPLNLNPSYRSILDIAFPVDILESNNCFDEELFCHFYWQLRGYGERQEVGFAHYNLFDNDRLFESISLNVQATNIVEELKKHLGNGYYILSLLDEFYIPCRSSFNRRHYMHGNLIFGFEDKQQFIAAAYDDHSKYTATAFTEQELLSALRINYMPGLSPPYLIAVKPRKKISFPKKPDLFLYYLKAHLYSFDGFHNDTILCGLQAVEKMARDFSVHTSIVSLYTIKEHKELTQKRLHFLNYYGIVPRDFSDEYQVVVDQARMAVMLWIKWQLTGQINHADAIQKILLCLIEKEKTILGEVISQAQI